MDKGYGYAETLYVISNTEIIFCINTYRIELYIRRDFISC